MAVWKDIPGFEGLYQVSDTGQVKSLPRVATRITKRGTEIKQPIRERVLKANTNKRGYQYVILRRDGFSVTREIHVLVAAAFLGPRPEGGYQVRHMDGDSLNNSLSNLQYGTRSENQLDLYAYRGYHHKLTPEDVLNIRSRLEAGETGRALAREYGVAETNISSIKHGGTYAWLK